MLTVIDSSGVPCDRHACGRFAAGQVAAVNRVLLIRARRPAWRKDEIHARLRVDRQPIKILRPAAIQEVVDGDDVLGLGWGRKIDQRVAPVRVAVSRQFAAGCIQHGERGVHPRVDPFGRALDQHTLPGGKFELVVIDGVGIRAAVDGHSQADFRRGGRRTISSGLRDLVPAADHERSGVGRPKTPHQPGFVDSGRHIGGDRYLERVGNWSAPSSRARRSPTWVCR